MTNEPYLVTTKRHMRDVIELHSACGWSPDEQTRLTEILSDTNFVGFLIGDEKPVGYASAYVEDKSCTGLWAGIIPDQRGGGKYRKLCLSLWNECQARGAIVFDTYIADKNHTFTKTISMHEQFGFTIVDSFPDYAFVEGKKVECINYHLRMMLTKKENRESDIDEE